MHIFFVSQKESVWGQDKEFVGGAIRSSIGHQQDRTLFSFYRKNKITPGTLGYHNIYIRAIKGVS